ncbi:unnamed protein product [Cuscuta epithymum]|uniref:Uncharacterized protein n=1 Tax=Cuscuta epithymum TaxID=186058 RepID=A0AAV0G2E4_9ASTE|nr:unnamed protein product [Cuscuta epithymum]
MLKTNTRKKSRRANQKKIKIWIEEGLIIGTVCDDNLPSLSFRVCLKHLLILVHTSTFITTDYNFIIIIKGLYVPFVKGIYRCRGVASNHVVIITDHGQIEDELCVEIKK